MKQRIFQLKEVAIRSMMYLIITTLYFIIAKGNVDQFFENLSMGIGIIVLIEFKEHVKKQKKNRWFIVLAKFTFVFFLIYGINRFLMSLSETAIIYPLLNAIILTIIAIGIFIFVIIDRS